MEWPGLWPLFLLSLMLLLPSAPSWGRRDVPPGAKTYGNPK